MRRQRFVLGGVLALATCLLLGPTLAAAGPVVVQAAGPDAESIQPVVDVFREALGDLNPNVAGSFPTGRREINWDGVPDNFAAPNLLPPDFFNVNSPRGAVFETPGTGVQVSANLVNPTNTPIEFGNINPTYPDIFRTFSPQRLFTALDSTITVVHFFVPGSDTPATVSGFGAVFTDVDIPTSTKIEYFDAHDKLLFRAFVQPLPKQDETLSFLGVRFDEGERIAKVRITSGNAKLSPTTFDGKSDRRDDDEDDESDRGDDDKSDKRDDDKSDKRDDDKSDKRDDDKSDKRVVDLVVMDDFIYGEPQAR